MGDNVDVVQTSRDNNNFWARKIYYSAPYRLDVLIGTDAQKTATFENSCLVRKVCDFSNDFFSHIL